MKQDFTEGQTSYKLYSKIIILIYEGPDENDFGPLNYVAPLLFLCVNIIIV